MEDLHSWSTCKTTTKRHLLSLIGKLVFAARAVPAGRFFIHRLINLSMKPKRLHHKIRLDQEARAGIQWWQSFLPTWNGKAFFTDSIAINATHMELYTDAAGIHGCGAYFHGNWFHHDWQLTTSLFNWQELFAIPDMGSLLARKKGLFQL